MSHVRCSVAAQAAQDGAGKPYPSLVIPEPADYERWEKEMVELRKVPRAEIGSNPDVNPPANYKSMVLERGAAPVELVMTDGLFRQLSVDKKNLLIFNVQKLDDDKPRKGLKE